MPVETINIFGEVKLSVEVSDTLAPGGTSRPIAAPDVVTFEPPTNIETIFVDGFCITKPKEFIVELEIDCLVSATANVIVKVVNPRSIALAVKTANASNKLKRYFIVFPFVL